MAARDFLEAAGREVPSDLIVMPAKPVVTYADTARLTPPPETPPLGTTPGGMFAPVESSGVAHPTGATPPMFARPGMPGYGHAPSDSLAPHFPAPGDTVKH